MCEAGIGVCTADPPKDGSARIFKAEAQRAQRKSPKNTNLNKPSVNSVVNISSQETQKNPIIRKKIS